MSPIKVQRCFSGEYGRRALRLAAFFLLFWFLWMPLSAAASTDKNIVKIGSDFTVEADQKVHNVITIGGQITVSGTVDKDVLAIGGSVVLTKTAVVKGSVASLGGVIVIARDAEVGGDLTEINSSNLFETLTAAVSSEWEGWSWIFAVISISIFLVILVLALLISALLPKPVRIVSEAIQENTFKVVLCGLLGLVSIAPLFLLLTISIVGIALIPLEVIIVVCSALLGFIASGRIIGAKFLRLLKKPDPGIVRETFWGLLILWLIGWIPYYIGWMVKVLAVVIGLGAVLVSRFGTHQGWKHSPEPPAAAVQGGPAEPLTSAAPITPQAPPVPEAAETLSVQEPQELRLPAPAQPPPEGQDTNHTAP